MYALETSSTRSDLDLSALQSRYAVVNCLRLDLDADVEALRKAKDVLNAQLDEKLRQLIVGGYDFSVSAAHSAIPFSDLPPAYLQWMGGSNKVSIEFRVEHAYCPGYDVVLVFSLNEWRSQTACLMERESSIGKKEAISDLDENWFVMCEFPSDAVVSYKYALVVHKDQKSEGGSESAVLQIHRWQTDEPFTVSAPFDSDMSANPSNSSADKELSFNRRCGIENGAKVDWSDKLLLGMEVICETNEVVDRARGFKFWWQ